MLLVTLLQRLALALVGYISLEYLSWVEQPWSQYLLDIWNRWDAPHYLKIAQTGYQTEGEERLFLVFFPVYPAAVKLASLIIPNFILSGLLVSWIAQIIAGAFLWRLVRERWDEATAKRAVLYLYFFPTGYFLTTPYTESLFLMLVLISFYLAGKGKWLWAGITGAFAWGTRLTGATLFAGLLTGAFYQGRRGVFLRVACLSLSLVGLAFYLLINWQASGDPLQFVRFQKEHWYNSPAPPWVPLVEAIKNISQGGLSWDMGLIYWGRLTATFLCMGLLFSGIKKIKLSHQIYGWTGLLMPLSTSWLISLPRYILPLFPIFIVLGGFKIPTKAHFLLLSLCGLIQLFFFSFYARGWWTF